MKSRAFRKGLSMLLVLITLFSIMPLSVTTDAADVVPKVEIVSFMRGTQTDLRASELLEARVTGYDGNVSLLMNGQVPSVRICMFIIHTICTILMVLTVR